MMNNVYVKYSDESILELVVGFNKISQLYSELTEKILFFEANIKNAAAREYLMHGVKRRIEIMNQCIENIFEDFPPETEKLLGIHKTTDINIYLHAFLINTYGAIENLALFITYEKNIFNSPVLSIKQRKKVGLFKKEFQNKLPSVLHDYFSNNPKLNNWYNVYAKNYRDALAHRIPPFVPPMQFRKEEAEEFKKLDENIANFDHIKSDHKELREMVQKTWTIGSPAKYFFHSISEKSQFVILHGQILNDFITLNDMIHFVLDNINN